MAITTFKGVARSVEGLRVEAKSRGMRVVFDEPESLGGSNEGLNPIEMLLNTLGACQVITAKTYAPKLEINLQKVWVEVEGDVNLDGFRGVPGIKSGLTGIRFKMHFVTDAPENKVKLLAKEVEKRCPISNTLESSVKLHEMDIVCESPDNKGISH